MGERIRQQELLGRNSGGMGQEEVETHVSKKGKADSC